MSIIPLLQLAIHFHMQPLKNYKKSNKNTGVKIVINKTIKNISVILSKGLEVIKSLILRICL